MHTLHPSTPRSVRRFLTLFLAGLLCTSALSGAALGQSESPLGDDRFEPNDAVGQATPLEPGEYDDLTITEGDVDFYAVDVEAGDAISASLNFSHAQGDLDLYVLSPAAEVVARNVTETDDENVSAVAAQSGTYYVAVVGFENATARYDLGLTVSDGDEQTAADELEPNDSFDTARSLDPGTFRNLSITRDDVDVYAVDVATGETVSSRIDFAHSAGDLDLFLFGPDRSPLQQSTSQTDGESVTHVASEGGTYYVAVAGFDGATAEYDMVVERSTDSSDGTTADDRFEPNDNRSTATPLDPGTYETLAITDGDFDVFTVDLEAGERLTADVRFRHSEGDIDAGLFGPTGEFLQSSESVTDDERLSVVADQAGAYTILVLSATNGTTPYSLEVAVEDAGGGTDTPVSKPVPVGEFEPNDDFDSATRLAPGRYENLSLTADDADVYAVEGAAGETLSASINFSHAAGDLGLLLFDESRRVLERSTSDTDSERVSTELENNGTYYLVVASADRVSTTYDLTLVQSGATRPDPERDVLGWENGYWANETLPFDTTDGFSAAERSALLARGMARVELIREAEFQRDVGFQVISREDASRLFEGPSSEREQRTQRLNQLYEATFIVDEQTDAYEVVVGTESTSIGGFYIFGTDQFYLITENTSRPMVDEGTLVHELVHALQDQRNLLTPSSESLTHDQQAARRGLSEGEANYVMAEYEARCANGTWSCVADPPRNASRTADVNLAVDLLGFQPYSDGPALVADLLERGGWDAVEAAYDDPPASTEQTINPDRYPEEEPAALPDRTDPTGDWRAFDRERLGEAWIFTMFWYQTREYGIPVIEDRVTEPDQGRYDTLNYTSRPSDGWANDRLTMYTADGEYGYVWTTAWDSAENATQFADAYRQVLEGHGAESTGARTWVVPEGQPYADAFRVVRDGRTVTIVNGPDETALADLAPALVPSDGASNGTATETPPASGESTEAGTATPTED